MAEPIVGQSIEKPAKPTDVPGGASVPADAAQAAISSEFEDVGSQDMGSPQPAPQPLKPIQPPDSEIPSDFEDLGPDDGSIIEDVPDYANGLSPETAINKFPGDFMDRFNVAAGNKVGSLKYLKQKYGAANIDKRGKFQIQKDGLWYQFDPEGLGEGDAWERTKELARDAADRSFTAIQLGAIGARGGPLAAAGGALAGFIAPDLIESVVEALPETDAEVKSYLAKLGIAGATPVAIAALKQLKNSPALLKGVGSAGLISGASEAARTSLGRLVGTYEATPEQQLKDIGWEAMLGLGGETVPLGVKPTLQTARNALAKTAVETSNYGKEVLSATYSGLTGQPRWAFRRAMDGTDAVLSKTEQALKELGPGKSPLEAIDIIKSKQNGIATALANESDSALKGNYRKNLGELIAKTPENFTFNPKDSVNQAMAELADQGFGRLVKNGDRTVFRLVDDKELASMLGTTQDQLPKILGPNTKKAMAEIGDILNKYSNFPELAGKQGVNKTLELKRAIRESLDDITSSDSAPVQIKKVAADILNKVEKDIGQSFSNVGSVDSYIKMNADYSKNADIVKLLKKAVTSGNPNELDQLVQKLTSKAGSFRQLKDEAGDLANLLGMDRVQQLVDWEAAKSFLDFVPKGNAAEGVVSSAVKGFFGSTVASPRSAGATIKYGNKTLDFLKRLGPQQINNLLKDDKRLTEVLSLGGQLGVQEADEVNKLLNQAGVKQPGEQ